MLAIKHITSSVTTAQQAGLDALTPVGTKALFTKEIELTGNVCSGSLESTMFWMMFSMGILFVISFFMVFEPGADKDEKPSLSGLLLIWLWPIRPFYTSEGLNELGKKWRPFYIASITGLFLLGSIMSFFDLCTSNT